MIIVSTSGSPTRGDIFQDTTVPRAFLDRVRHHASVLNITGDSYRMRAHRARTEQLRKGVNQPKTT